MSDFVRDIKKSTNIWMKKTGHYPQFTSWAEGSCILTYSFRDKEKIVNYIKNQKEYHGKVSFEDEYIALLKVSGIVYDEKYVF